MRYQPVSCFIVCLCVALAASPLSSQSPAPDATQVAPTIKIDTRVVLVDVVVTDDQGDTVAGLEKKDFQLADEGAPQLISAFEEHKGAQPVQISFRRCPPMSLRISRPRARGIPSISCCSIFSTPSRATRPSHALKSASI